MLSIMKEELMDEFYIYPEESENSFNPLNFVEKQEDQLQELTAEKG